MGGGRLPDCSPIPPKENLKNAGFVDIRHYDTKVIQNLRFSLEQPLKLADD